MSHPLAQSENPFKICARIGIDTHTGLSGVLKRHYLFFWKTSMEVEEVGKLHNTIVVDKKQITEGLHSGVLCFGSEGFASYVNGSQHKGIR